MDRSGAIVNITGDGAAGTEHSYLLRSLTSEALASGLCPDRSLGDDRKLRRWPDPDPNVVAALQLQHYDVGMAEIVMGHEDADVVVAVAPHLERVALDRTGLLQDLEYAGRIAHSADTGLGIQLFAYNLYRRTGDRLHRKHCSPS